MLAPVRDSSTPGRLPTSRVTAPTVFTSRHPAESAPFARLMMFPVRLEGYSPVSVVGDLSHVGSRSPQRGARMGKPNARRTKHYWRGSAERQQKTLVGVEVLRPTASSTNHETGAEPELRCLHMSNQCKTFVGIVAGAFIHRDGQADESRQADCLRCNVAVIWAGFSSAENKLHHQADGHLYTQMIGRNLARADPRTQLRSGRIRRLVWSAERRFIISITSPQRPTRPGPTGLW